jgi:hypothetical protein
MATKKHLCERSSQFNTNNIMQKSDNLSTSSQLKNSRNQGWILSVNK